MKELVGSLTAVAFLSYLAEALLPEGSFQKYARMVSGLLVLSVLFSTLTGNRDFLNFSWEAVPETLQIEAAEAEREANLTVEYRRRLEEEIKEKTSLDAHVELGGNLEILSVTLEGEVSEELRREISREYGIDTEKVRGVTP